MRMELDDDSHVQSTFARVWNWRVYSRSLFIYVGSYLRGFQRSGTLVGGHAFRFLTILSIASIVCALCALTMSLGYRYFPARADCGKFVYVFVVTRPTAGNKVVALSLRVLAPAAHGLSFACGY